MEDRRNRGKRMERISRRRMGKDGEVWGRMGK
jgi:hypothetical protein